MRYQNQDSELPTVKCKTCRGWTFYEGSSKLCSDCDNTSQVSPYSIMPGDEVYPSNSALHEKDIWLVTHVIGERIFMEARDRLHSKCNHTDVRTIILINPCLDTVERQALQEKLDK